MGKLDLVVEFMNQHMEQGRFSSSTWKFEHGNRVSYTDR